MQCIHTGSISWFMPLLGFLRDMCAIYYGVHSISDQAEKYTFPDRAKINLHMFAFGFVAIHVTLDHLDYNDQNAVEIQSVFIKNDTF